MQLRAVGGYQLRFVLGKVFRVDAKAIGLPVVISGWEVQPAGAEARWFLLELCPTRRHGLTIKGPSPGETYRVSATLERAAVVVAVMVFIIPAIFINNYLFSSRSAPCRWHWVGGHAKIYRSR